jgi:hypothetical protein
MDKSRTEIEVIFKKEFMKLKLGVDVSVVSSFQRTVCYFQYQAYYEMSCLTVSILSYIFQRTKTN